MHARNIRVMASEGDEDKRRGKALLRSKEPAPAEDFPYTVELWDHSKQTVEQVLAVASSAAVALAAFYAAAREHGDRFITLRHKTGIINRWNGPAH